MGLDAAGVVEAVGAGVTRFRPGDRVFADLFSYGAGAFAEYVCARETAFWPIPAGMSFETAATLPHSAVLALQGLASRDGRTIGPGDQVLIDGASGNVGPFAVQIAKARGAEVTGVCRTEKMEFVRSLGADHVLDYTQVDYTSAAGRYDWIVDTDSHHSILAVRRALRPNGVYVTLGGTTGSILGVDPRRAADLPASATAGPGLLLWWKPFHRAGCRDRDGADRGGTRHAGHRSSLPVERRRGGPPVGRRRPRPGEGPPDIRRRRTGLSRGPVGTAGGAQARPSSRRSLPTTGPEPPGASGRGGSPSGRSTTSWRTTWRAEPWRHEMVSANGRLSMLT